ncbi:MAG: hypothetical protein K6T83_22065, partial [Alicyclobacillus sp.]|nr:hypothetical protein [Alicyclobacillus sp.]
PGEPDRGAQPDGGELRLLGHDARRPAPGPAPRSATPGGHSSHLMHSTGQELIASSMQSSGPPTGLRRQALHAMRLAWRHPVTGEYHEVVAPVPQDMQRAWRLLGGEDEVWSDLLAYSTLPRKLAMLGQTHR